MAPIGMEADDSPPEMEIEMPKEGYIHLSNIMDPCPSPSDKTMVIAFPWMAPFEIKVRAKDNSGPVNVHVYIDGFYPDEPWRSDSIKLESVGLGYDLYTGTLRRTLLGNHELTFVCYDRYGLVTIDEMDTMFLYMPRPSIILK